MSSVVPPVYESENATVWAFTGPLLGSKHFLVHEHQRDITIVIDSGFGVSAAVDTARRVGRETVALYLTHGHFDHAGGAAQISAELKCPVKMNAADFSTIKASNFLLKILGHSVRMQMPQIELVSGAYSDEIVSFMACPGHTPGSVLIKCGNILFTGDSLYAERIDEVVLPQQDNDLLRRSLLSHLADITSAIRIFPGHGLDIAGSDLVKRNKQLMAFLGVGRV